MKFILLSCKFSIIALQVSGQLTKVKFIDTLQINGVILFIDSLPNMTPIPVGNHYGGNDLPYYLILLRTDSKITNHPYEKIVIRKNGIKNLTPGNTYSFKIRRTQYESPKMETEKGEIIMDSVLNKVNKRSLTFSLLERRPDYVLKERLYFRYEVIEP
ncbi:MAG: hypothetical protein ACXWEY_17080 [Bacteroidia bacterium]